MTRRIPHLRAALIVLVLAAVVVAGYVAFFGPGPQKHLTMYFQNSVGLYTGNEVKILGVTVGQVDGITPEGKYVKVEMSYDAHRKLPDDVKGAIIAPSLVTGRFVQLSPAYAGGPVLPDHAVITYDAADPRTATPVEWPQVERELTKLVTALGPTSTDKSGVLSSLVTTASANLNSTTAHDLRSTITGLSDAVNTLESSKGDLFSTVRNLESFVSNLATNNDAVAGFTQQLSVASGVLADNSSDLKTAVAALQPAFAELRDYVNKNRSAVTTAVTRSSTLAKTLLGEQYALADILHAAPTAIDDFYNLLDPRYGAVTGRLALANLQDLTGLLCNAGGLAQLTPDVVKSTCTTIVDTLTSALGIKSKGDTATSASALPTAAASTGSPQAGSGSPTPANPVFAPITAVTSTLLGLLSPGGN